MKRRVDAGFRQPPAKVTADSASAYDRDSHGSNYLRRNGRWNRTNN